MPRSRFGRSHYSRPQLGAIAILVAIGFLIGSAGWITDTPASNPQSVNSMAGIESAYADIKSLVPSF